MSREIKFRAWDGKRIWWNVQAAYDTLHCHQRPTCEQIDYCDCDNRVCFYPSSFGSVLDEPDRYKVMQYTGLKDRRGREIYEGDIVNVYHWLNGEIDKYRTHKSQVVFKAPSFDIKPACYREQLDEYGCDCEVIGNVYENPELLERQDAAKHG